MQIPMLYVYLTASLQSTGSALPHSNFPFFTFGITALDTPKHIDAQIFLFSVFGHGLLQHRILQENILFSDIDGVGYFSYQKSGPRITILNRNVTRE